MTGGAPLSPVKAARREKILDAAESLFGEQGFRATTMEGLADAAGMSKVTLYGYFRDKDAVFDAVADRLADQFQMAVAEALSAPGKLADRIAAGLIAKQRLAHERVRTSPFAPDLMAAKAQISAERFAALDRTIETMIADALRAEGWANEPADRTAHLLFAAAAGIGDHGTAIETVARDIATLVDAVIAAEEN